jgi:hypothetical protein
MPAAGVVRIETMRDVSDAYVMGLTQRGLLLRESDLGPAFFDLSSGIAGELFQKFVNTRIPLAIVVADPKARGERFGELAYEHQRHPTVRILPTEEDARRWLRI